VTDWDPGPQQPLLEASEIHVWRIGLGLSQGEREHLARFLVPEEHEKADRFRFDRHRHRFTVARAALREILSRYLGAEPGAIVFEVGEHGKPRLGDSAAGLGVCFNATDSSDLALVAVTRHAEVGVDLEQMVPERAGGKLAKRFFSATEAETLAALSPEVRVQGFFNCWTRKEAFLKAIGTGLNTQLDSFAVSFVPDEPPRLLFVDGDPEAPDRWSLTALHPAPGYAAAVAIERTDSQLSCWSWDGADTPK
jgi:4'-phosphopantetheinyl transferase